MKQNILNNHKEVLDAKLYNGNYYDFMLFSGKISQRDSLYLEDLCIADFSNLNIINGVLYSNKNWSAATNNGVLLKNIGFTGMDNGLISFRKDRITNEEFLKLYLNSEYKINSGDTRLFLNPITGNTQEYIYPMFLNDDETFIIFKGGFYQGFYKIEGEEYQVLPNGIQNEMTFHFELRPRTDYIVDDNTINKLHPNNKGIFFYIGTRAENKFWPFYKTNESTLSSMKKINAQTEGYFSGGGYSGDTYDITENSVIDYENNWVLEEFPEDKKYNGYFNLDDGYFSFNYNESTEEILKPNIKEFIIKNEPNKILKNSNFSLNTYDFNTNCSCHNSKNDGEIITPSSKPCISCCEEYFTDTYFDNKCPEIDNNKFVVDEYIGSGITINSDEYYDSEGHALNKKGYFEIISDNKFLLFDRTLSGYTVNNWEEGTKIALTGRKNWPDVNYFLLMNRTKTGYTAHTIEKYNNENEREFNIHKDIRNNAFALKINDDGSIGYRYGVFDCENDNKYSIIEEYSKPNIIKLDEWNKINVRFITLNNNKHIKIMFYVNGNLVFISKVLDNFNFKSLDEVPGKQETVPYNISIGGGSLGLLETIIPNYYAVSDYILPIERDFCGSFIGDIKSFKIYNGNIDYSLIKKYLS